jgi:hypothetical protein
MSWRMLLPSVAAGVLTPLDPRVREQLSNESTQDQERILHPRLSCVSDRHDVTVSDERSLLRRRPFGNFFIALRS